MLVHSAGSKSWTHHSFKTGPLVFTSVKHTPLSGPPEKQQALLKEVDTLLAKGAVERVSPRERRAGWYGNYFLVTK